jgi:hypothetical protein
MPYLVKQTSFNLWVDVDARERGVRRTQDRISEEESFIVPVYLDYSLCTDHEIGHAEYGVENAEVLIYSSTYNSFESTSRHGPDS